MARKIFVSYKYYDTLVAPIPELEDADDVSGTCRDYVDMTMGLLEGIEIYKGETDDQDLSQFKDTTIKTRLKEKIRDSTVTIVMISKGMKETREESTQWIPWEIKYSLYESVFDGRKKIPNGLIAVIIPDENHSYDHFYQKNDCEHCNTVTHKTNEQFKIIKHNMFNKKKPTTTSCPSIYHESTSHQGNDYSYMLPVKWHDFVVNPSMYVDLAIDRRQRIDEYNIRKVVKAA